MLKSWLQSGLIAGLVLFMGSMGGSAWGAPLDDAIRQLNAHSSVAVTAEHASYRAVFDAVIELSEPPLPIGPSFNLTTIHAKMPEWSKVSAWAEANPKLASAILAARDAVATGMPYGVSAIESKYRDAGLYVGLVGEEGRSTTNFAYLGAVDLVAAYATAETYRLFEAGRTDDALRLSVAHLVLLRQFCDRQFTLEKKFAIRLLTEALGNLCDQMYVYLPTITREQFYDLAWWEILSLRPEPGRLEMPEGDRVLAESILRSTFDADDQADTEKFAEVYGPIQARDEPLTRFGAVKRWAWIATVHVSLEEALHKLTTVYDDWWRRWRIKDNDPVLDLPTAFDKTNAIRYGAVVLTLEDVESLFEIRNELIAAVNGTAMAAGLCGYVKVFEQYPPDVERVYAQFCRKLSDSDPWHPGQLDVAYRPFKYRFVSSRHAVDTVYGRVWVEKNTGLLYARGTDREDNLAESHAFDGAQGDMVIWPPIKALAREQGLVP
ncbi:MAG: hypothetical protein KDA25_04675 [Phycisphaerales bacterium]|nr:hypothetical protein [Phycisphaerales bacterium]